MKVQSVALTMAVAFGSLGTIEACSNGPGVGVGGSSSMQGTSGSNTSGGAGSGAGGAPSAGTSAGGNPTASCDNVVGCGGPVTGTWKVSSSCLKISGSLDLADAGLDPTSCTSATVNGTLSVTGTFTANADTTYKDETVTTGTAKVELAAGCLLISAATIDCKGAANAVQAAGYATAECTPTASGGCSCDATVNQKGGLGIPSPSPVSSGNHKSAGNVLSLTTDSGDKNYGYCASGGNLTVSPQNKPPTVITGSIAFQPPGAGGGGSGGAGGTGAGGSGGAPTAGAAGMAGAGGGGPGTKTDGPCDIYAAGNTPCVAAYSMVRALKKSYTGPLFQARSGSSAQNTGTGGMTKDIGQTADGYADTAALEAHCAGTICTVSLLYDQSGNDNNLPVAKKGLPAGGTYSAMDDFESSATKGAVMAGGHKVYPLYMAAREGYRTPVGMKGKNMPLGTASQGIYEVADGMHFGTPCCWDFGNVSTDPTKYGVMNTLFFGKAFWGNGAGSGPWFMADFEAGVWAGGSNKGDPGWGELNDAHPSNPANPSMAVPFAMGILKTQSSKYALRSADVKTATNLTTSFEGPLPKAMNNLGGIVLGVGGDNSNNAWGTFFEGAIVAGYPTNEIDAAVLANVKAVGYAKP